MTETSKFSTEQVFGSREELITWVQNVARSQGFVIVTRRSRPSFSGYMSTIVLGCDRGGVSRSKDFETKKINCPFELLGKYLKAHDVWTLRVVCDYHNHKPTMYMEGHSYAMRLSDDESRLVQQLTRLNVKPRDVFTYLHNVWLDKYADRFVSLWTDKHINFGNSTTNRVESQHAKLKKHLDSGKCDLDKFIHVIEEVVKSQDTAIKESLERCTIIRKPKFNNSLFQQLQSFVSEYAMDNILEELHRSKGVVLTPENCGCQLRTCFGLPCAYELAIYIGADMPIPLDSVDTFWKKLDLSPSISVEYGDLNCDHDMEKFKEIFNNQPDHGKSSFLRKLRGIMDPSKILIGEPSVKKNTRGRPKVKRVHHQTQVPHRYSCSGLNQELPTHSSFFMDLNDDPPRHNPFFMDLNEEPPRHSPSFMDLNEEPPWHSSSFMDLNEELPRHNSSFMDLNEEPPRHNSSFMDLNEEPPIYSSSFMDLNDELISQSSHQIDLNEILPEGHTLLLKQIPEIFHPYITNIQDVRGDGNCGFRSIAVCLGYGEDQWLSIRHELLDELMSSYGAYSTVFYGIDEILTSLSYWDSPAPEQHWMTMPETGILIANRFGVILHLLTNGGSMTCFPLWKGPEEFQYHRVFTISHVNNNHYVMVQLEGEYPMPPISALWTRHKILSAAGWETIYMSRLEFYKKLKPTQKTFVNIAD